MTNRKNQNSILFLTTLGVYLGLLLVGGTPGVMAQHAATAKSFELKDEIEVRDDLDINPDDCSENASKLSKQLLGFDVVSNGVLAFVSEIDLVTKIGKTSWSENFAFEFLRTKSEGGIGRTSYEQTDNRSAQLAALENVNELVHLICPWNGCEYYRYDEDFKANATSKKVKYRLDGKELFLEISIEQRNDAESEKLAKIFEETFQIGACSSIYSTPQQQLVYKNTSANFSDSQVFIVTRLPRAGLDTLLAKDEK